ncbi:MAG: hypothetical protein WCK96_12825, partial [Methylococcales bacterium]
NKRRNTLIANDFIHAPTPCESINNFKKIFLVLCNNLQIRHCQMQQSSNPSLSDAITFNPVIVRCNNFQTHHCQMQQFSNPSFWQGCQNPVPRMVTT